MVKIYVAAGWKFRDDAAIFMKTLAEHGHEITSGWVDRENRINTISDYAMCAEADINEVTEADMVVAIMEDPEYSYRGTKAEIGCALGQKKPVLVICPGTIKHIDEKTDEFDFYCMKDVFYWHPLITHVKTKQEAIEFLREKDVTG